MITRRRFLLGQTLGLLVLPSLATAQAPTKVKRVGVILGGTRPVGLGSSVPGPFVQGMLSLGYIEGRDFVIEWRFAEGKYERLADFAAELVRMNVDVIVAFNTRGAVEAQRATKTIPIVFGSINDPLGSGLVSNLRHPGGNITGVSEGLDNTVLKHLDLMRQTVRRLSRVGVLINPDNVGSQLVSRLQPSAQALGISLLPVTARTADEMETRFVAMKSD